MLLCSILCYKAIRGPKSAIIQFLSAEVFPKQCERNKPEEFYVALHTKVNTTRENIEYEVYQKAASLVVAYLNSSTSFMVVFDDDAIPPYLTIHYGTEDLGRVEIPAEPSSLDYAHAIFQTARKFINNLRWSSKTKSDKLKDLEGRIKILKANIKEAVGMDVTPLKFELNDLRKEKKENLPFNGDGFDELYEALKEGAKATKSILRVEDKKFFREQILKEKLKGLKTEEEDGRETAERMDEI